MAGIDLGKLAVTNFRRFVSTISGLVVEERIPFDIVYGAGDSGVGMAELTRMVYESLHVAPPPILSLPVYRHEDEAETVLFDSAPRHAA